MNCYPRDETVEVRARALAAELRVAPSAAAATAAAVRRRRAVRAAAAAGAPRGCGKFRICEAVSWLLVPRVELKA